MRTSCATRIAIAIVLAGAPALAQQFPPPPEEAPAARAKFLRTNIYALKNAEAQQVAAVILGLYGKNGVMAVPHEATNSVLIQSPQPFLDDVVALIKELDVPPAGQPAERQLRIFPLKNRRADRDLEKLLAAALPGGNVKLATDTRANAVIVSGDAQSLVALEEVLAALDEPMEEDKGSAEAIRVRVVWLVAATDPDALSALKPVQQDLAPIVEELAKAGVTGLRTAADLRVQTVPGQNFQLQARPNVDKPCDLAIQGTVEISSGSHIRLPLSITAKHPDSGSSLISTTVLAPRGHPVVLCTTPAGDLTSVFVVEVR